MSFDRATVTYPDGRVAHLSSKEFYAIPLGDRIVLLTGRCLKFEKDNQVISPMEALKTK